MARLTKPDRIVWCDGSEEEKHRLTEEARRQGHPHPAQPAEAPRLLPPPVEPERRRARRAAHLHLHAHEGRGGPDQQLDGARRGVREARRALRRLDEGPHDVRRPLRDGPDRVAHSQGRRRADRQHLRRPQHAHHDAHGPRRRSTCSATRTTSTAACTRRSTATRSAASSATSRRTTRSGASAAGYGGNVLLGKKCLALRIGSYLGKQRGLARRAHAHPRRRVARGRDDLRRRRLPERVRQDQLRHDDPAQALQGLEDLDRRRRHRLDARRRRTAGSTPSTPRPATSASRRARTPRRNPNAMKTISHDTIFTNVAMTKDGDVWWEGKDGDGPRRAHRLEGQPVEEGLDREGRAPELALHRAGDQQPRAQSSSATTRRACPSAPSSSAAAARPRSRSSCRRSTGCTASSSARRSGSETTAAAAGKVGVVRRDPMAMLPFCGYNMGEYFAHWLDMQAQIAEPAEGLPGELVPARARTASSSGRATARTCACSSGSSTARACASAGRRRRSAGCPRRATSTCRASTSRTSKVDEATHIDLDEWQTELESHRRVLPEDRPDPAQGPRALSRAAPRPHRVDAGLQGQALAPRAAVLLSRIRVSAGHDDLTLPLEDAGGSPRRLVVLFGGEGTGKTAHPLRRGLHPPRPRRRADPSGRPARGPARRGAGPAVRGDRLVPPATTTRRARTCSAS